MSSPYIINVNEADFEFEVLHYSQNIPVVVDFWAEWCVPCKTLDPILRKLAEEQHGEFRLAKVNVDENQKLAMRFNVRSIPAVKGFREGVVIAEFSGTQPEDLVRKFLNEVVPSFTDLQIDKGFSLILMDAWESAEETFCEILDDQPHHSKALLGLAKCLASRGAGAEMLQILDRFPASREFGNAQQMRSLATALARVENEALDDSDVLETTYKRALKLVGRGNFPAALDGFLDILRQDKRYRDGEIRQVILGVFEILGGDDPTTRQYRNELASILF